MLNKYELNIEWRDYYVIGYVEFDGYLIKYI